MDVHCKRCDSAIPAEDVSLAHSLAKCRGCNAVFSFTVPPAGGKDAPVSGPPARRASVPLPPAIQVDDGIGKLSLTRKWFHPIFIFLAFFCVCWDGFIVFWYAMALFGTSAGASPFSILAILFPLGHVAVGVGLTYYTVAGFLNRTHIEVTRGTLKVRHEPLPWWGNQELGVAAIQQLFCEENVSHGKHGSRHYSYSVHAVLKGNRKQKLVGSLPAADQALYLEQAIEERLGIVDQPVRGELSRD